MLPLWQLCTCRLISLPDLFQLIFSISDTVFFLLDLFLQNTHLKSDMNSLILNNHYCHHFVYCVKFKTYFYKLITDTHAFKTWTIPGCFSSLNMLWSDDFPQLEDELKVTLILFPPIWQHILFFSAKTLNCFAITVFVFASYRNTALIISRARVTSLPLKLLEISIKFIAEVCTEESNKYPSFSYPFYLLKIHCFDPCHSLFSASLTLQNSNV